MFLDEANIIVRGGNGGRGCVSWRRAKFEPMGGPDGGNGGKGGDVILQADENADTLSDYVSRKRFEAPKGRFGSGSNRNGKAGDDLLLLVPPGTLVFEITGGKTPEIVADLSEHGDQIVIARGGRGGFGNAHFTSSVRQSPDFAELGEPGEEKAVKLELKLVADIGIIGFPSVGKSSLIAVVSSARPKIADYPFTTLVPNLGVVNVANRSFVICDVPGLIEGASEGKGLGDQFLKHIERCGVLLHMLDISRGDPAKLAEEYETIRRELRAFSPALTRKKEFVILNKIDLLANDAAEYESALQKKCIKVFASISAATKFGTDDLMKKLLPVALEERKNRQAFDQEQSEKDILPILRPHEQSNKMGAFRIEQNGDRIIVRGKRLEQFTKMTDFGSDGGTQRFRDVLERIGLTKAIKRVSKENTAVFIGGTQVDGYL